jgi:hypothetical protein
MNAKQKQIINISFVAAIAVVIGLIFFLSGQMNEENVARSPQQIYPIYDGPGTGHGFGYDIVYTIERHATYDGKEMAIIFSGAQGEGHVEIWSPIPDLVALPDGSTFQLSEAESWDKAFKVLKRGT